MIASSLLERYSPRFDFVERHELPVAASAQGVWRQLLDLDLGGSPIIRTLFRLRGLPAGALRLDGLERLGFVRLGERPERELALGVVGKFWTPTGCLQHLTPEGFAGFRDRGFAKAVWTFQLDPNGGARTLLSTETRILCLDAASCVRFRAYWLLVRPLSGWTRKEALELIRKRSEAAAATSA